MTGARRFRHEAAIYGSDDELLAVAVPFLREGIEAGEPTLLGVDEREQRLILDALDDTGGITPLEWGDVYASPYAALESNHRTLNDLLANGAPRVRVLGAVPSQGTAATWDGWARYEAAVNHLYEPLDVWSVCPYDTRRISDDVLADVERTHTHLAAPDGSHVPIPAYTDPAAFLTERARQAADPLEAEAPHVAERDPTPGEARRTITALAKGTSLDAATVERLLLAVSEVVTNATVHGAPPVDLRGWATADRIVVTVRDRGPGPDDPFVGFLPRRDQPGGVGLWIANQACSRVALLPEPEGFTVRITVGAPPG